ncbi:MAG: PD-(D/E)XK nuclease family transposase, partial [Lachnospiraceae bacterium]|nr:PD-(D/E)XK nuclease family transposase [Lachnospiraceae bacterium]
MKNTNIGEQPVNNDAGKTQYRFVSATGPIPCRMINDYIFRIVLQTNEEALKNLIGAILHLKEGIVTSVTVMNPIDPGKSVTDKEIRMDLRVDVR